MSNFSFIQNLSEAEKIGLVFEITYNMYLFASLFSLVVSGRGDILDVRNPSKEMGTWKGKARL